VDSSRAPPPTLVGQTQPIPPAFGDALTAGLAALHLTLTHEARAAIDGHARLLLAWTAAINLTAIRDPAAVALAHVVDSLAAVSVLRERGMDRFMDLGSGGGYPGIPIAAALPAARALLLEPIRKKAAFLATVLGATALAPVVESAPVRIEALARDARHRARWPAVTARAVASLGELIELCFPVLQPNGVLIAWKRGDIDTEVAGAQLAMAAMGGGTLERIPVEVPGLDGHVLVIVTARGAAPAAYPRDPGARKRRPW
jgi:16S rRNA (guanine527-N7)-methyltransferase